MKITKATYQKGETLLEALAALAIIGIVIAAVATTIISALSNTIYNKNTTLATKFAQQGMEEVRKIRNANYTAFRTYDGTYCLAKGQEGLGIAQSSCQVANVDTFVRSVQIEQVPGCSADVARVTVNVAFRDGKCQGNSYCHVQSHMSCLSTINPVLAP